MYLVCVLFVVCGWPNGRQLMSDGLRPTKTNTNNNTRPVIQLHIHISQPILNKSFIHRGTSGQETMLQKLRVQVPLEKMHFSWKRFQIFQNTIDFVIKVGLWLRLSCAIKLQTPLLFSTTFPYIFKSFVFYPPIEPGHITPT